VPSYKAITKTDFANLRWKRYDNYHFAALDAVVPLVVQELPKACMALPIAFIEQGDAFVPAALQGLQPGQNLFVTPDGRWLGGYTPAAYRSYPFQLATAADGQRVLVIDEESGLLSDTEGEAFFDEAGNPAQAVKEVLDFLSQVQNNRALTQRICALLAEHHLIQPWPIKVKGEAGERTVEGLYRIDEAALNALAADAFEALRQAGALPVAYCQLLSMQHVQLLGKLAEAHANAQAQLPTTDSGELDLDFLNNNDTISFGSH
jgi:hypothetical protein